MKKIALKRKKQIIDGLLMVLCVMLCLYGCKTASNRDYAANDTIQTYKNSDIAEVDTSAWYLHNYSCKFKVATPNQAKAIRELYGLPAKVGSEIDLSDLTQYFNHIKKGGFGPCEKGKQITSYDILEPVIAYE